MKTAETKKCTEASETKERRKGNKKSIGTCRSTRQCQFLARSCGRGCGGRGAVDGWAGLAVSSQLPVWTKLADLRATATESAVACSSAEGKQCT